MDLDAAFVADKDHDKGGIKKFFFFGLLFKMLSLLVLAGVLGYGLKKIAIQTYKAAFTKKGFWKQVGKGFLFIVVGPIAVIILFVLGVTWPLAFILLFSWIATLIAAVGMTAVVVGSWLYGWILRRKDKKAEYDGAPNWKSLLLGVAAMFIIGLIPVLGTLFIFILICSVLGAFYDIKMKAYKKL